ncbi:MAG: class I SAM-dependent methyltransferase [Burkholderiales bacterium]|nr:class I SAM-dependent methyltransferase [Burkholderiales bacterium]
MIKHRYAHEIDPNGGSAAAVLARMVEPGQRVLELGTGPGTVTRILHDKGCKVTGVEMDPDTLATCAPFCERTLQANLEDPLWWQPLEGEKFEVIICADVLEHLRDPRPLLEKLPVFLREGGCVLMSLPNASHLTIVASLLGGRFPYQKNGLLDNTHLKFYGREDLDALLRECGFLWQHWHTVQVDPSQAELKQYWNDLEASDQEFLKARGADGMVYQHVVRAFPTSAAGHLNKLQKDLMELEQSHRAEVSRMYEKFEFEKQAWLVEQASVADRTKAEAKQKELEFNSQMNLLLEVQENTQNTLAWTEGQLDNHKHSMQELTTEILSLKTSTSWRMTEPLRTLLRKISG